MDDDVLDNPVWHALTGLQARFGVRHGDAARFHPDVAPFFAIETASESAYRGLAAILGDAPEIRLFRTVPEPAPPGWRKTFEKPIVQMVCARGPRVRPEAPVVPMAPSDVADMMGLAERARPGPFGARTAELGAYVGVRVHGRLVAMAGERFKMRGCTEVSAICTLPAYRGRGFGGALVGQLADTILARGETPFLHVFPDNPAIRLYEAMGFQERARLTVVWLARVSNLRT